MAPRRRHRREISTVAVQPLHLRGTAARSAGPHRRPDPAATVRARRHDEGERSRSSEVVVRAVRRSEVTVVQRMAGHGNSVEAARGNGAAGGRGSHESWIGFFLLNQM